jgi:hypothetical protein
MRDFIRLLLLHRVEFIICGGHAVAFHGYPRLTMDLDLLVKPTPANARKLMTVLDEFGFGDAGIPPESFTRPGSAITLGAQPNQIDLLTSIGLSDDVAVFTRAIAGDIDNLSVRYVAKHDLIKAKQEAGRPKDLADIVELNQIQEPDSARGPVPKRRRNALAGKGKRIPASGKGRE